MVIRLVILALVLLTGCIESRGDGQGKGPGPTANAEAGVCIDDDHDGYGDSCQLGHDCDDDDAAVHEGCLRCAIPSEGCACTSADRPVSCFLETTTADDGATMCHEGTRYCRAGTWSGCESIISYVKPEGTLPQAAIAPDSEPEHCSNCDVNCFVIRDNLDPQDGGLGDGSAANTSLADGGGLTLELTPEVEQDGAVFDPSACIPGTAPDQDCDGIPDVYDPYPLEKPFQTANPAIFLDIAPGEKGTGVVDLEFFLNSADIYFLVDQSGSMEGERDRLKADLTTGDFIQDDSFACSDFDFDFVPNNEQKGKGIIGAIRCLIRDANFGVGLFREIPFTNYAPLDQVVFANYQDITDSIASVITGVSKLTTEGNNEWPEASMLALNSVVTGNGMYFGTTKPGIPTRTGCPAGTWGYPCFREGAIPIVIMFTDAMFHNGPADNAYPYDAASLGITQGTAAGYTRLASTNETYLSAADLGDITASYISYVGDTSTMAADLNHSAVSCSSSTDASGRDALFRFTLGATKTVSITTEGSSFDTSLALLSAIPTGAATALPTFPNTNDTVATAYSFGNVDNQYVYATGNSSTLATDYFANDIGCSAHPSANDAVFTFSVPSTTRVAIDSSGTSYGTSLSLFAGTPAAVPAYSAVVNTNDSLTSALATGALYNGNKGYSGDTSAAGITANFTGAHIGCGAADAARDAVYSFSLAQATRVRISAENSPLDTVLALTDGVTAMPVTGAVSSTNEAQASAYDVGVVDGKAFQLTGNTSGMAANYSGALTGCSASDSSADAIYKFTLGSTKTVQLDTDGSSFDTVVSLFSSQIASPETYVALSSNNHETGSLAYSLGSVNAKKLVVTGGSTQSMVSNYTDLQTGCNASTSGADAVFKFHVDTTTNVRIDTDTSAFDTTISLHNTPLPDQSIIAVTNGNEAQASAYVAGATSNTNRRFDGSTASMAANVPIDDSIGCSADATAKDAVFSFTVATAGNYVIDTSGSSFDTVVGLFPSTIFSNPAPAATAVSTANETKATAYDVGAMDSKWVSFTGSTATMSDDNNFNSCGAHQGARDAYFKFSLASTKTITIDTNGSTLDTVIGLFRSTGDTQLECDDEDGAGSASLITRSLDAGDYYVIIKGPSNNAGGAYKISFKESSLGTNLLACDDESGDGTASSLTAALTPGTYHVVVKGRAAGDNGNYRLAIRHQNWVDNAGRVTCDDDTGVGNASRIDWNLSPGDYYVVVSGTSSSAKGSYTLTIQDTTTPPPSYYLDCNDNNGSLVTSRLTKTLNAGTYYAVVRGRATTNLGAYSFNIKDTSAPINSVIECDYSDGANGTSLIERDLTAGTYHVVVKGKAAADAGAYKLEMRDVTHVGAPRLACNQTSSSSASGGSYIDQTLAGGTYTVVMRGTSASASGNYQLIMRDATDVARDPVVLACDDDSGAGTTSKISRSLTAGNYWVALKGKSGNQSGAYQLNIGAGTTTSSTYVPPTWSETRTALEDQKVRVMTVLSCKDDPDHGDTQGDCNSTRTQADALANTTDTLGDNLEPLVYDILGDGSGLSSSVVDGVAALARYLEMDVQVRVSFSPDANPGFLLVVRAIDQPGDGCDDLIGLEHQNCVPGASPRFQLEFTNPAGSPVPLNPNDPNGGYNFRAELIGDDQFIVDQIPIYIIPADVVDDGPPAPTVIPEGSYWQDIPAKGCTGNKRPDWRDLSWNAEVPNGTMVSFNVCTGETPESLETCTYSRVCTVTGGADCASDADCSMGGFCSSAGNCQTITSGTCQNDTQCPFSASCISGYCTFEGQPVYIANALSTSNFKTYLRMQLNLTANTAGTLAPTVHDWALTYICNNKL